MNSSLRELVALLAEIVINELVTEQATSTLSPTPRSDEGDVPDYEHPQKKSL